MIYTSYFAKLKKLPKNIIPVSICAKVPSWYNGLQYKKLAPKYEFFMEWKQNHNNDYYIKCFKEQVTDQLNPNSVVAELDDLLLSATISINCNINNTLVPEIALICYEKPTDFCHRHLVSKWLKENGYNCEEIEL